MTDTAGMEEGSSPAALPPNSSPTSKADLRLGLALSGGEMRAAVFHLGVLGRLAAGGFLENVCFVSTVSGGSLGTGLVYTIAGEVRIALVQPLALPPQNMLYLLHNGVGTHTSLPRATLHVVVLVRDAGGWMPIYKFKCENGHVFDMMQKLFDDPLASCIECSAPVRKVMQPVNISFKGSGFYSTDYRGDTKAETTTKNGDSGDKGNEKKSSSSEKVSANV